MEVSAGCFYGVSPVKVIHLWFSSRRVLSSRLTHSASFPHPSLYIILATTVESTQHTFCDKHTRVRICKTKGKIGQYGWTREMRQKWYRVGYGKGVAGMQSSPLACLPPCYRTVTGARKHISSHSEEWEIVLGLSVCLYAAHCCTFVRSVLRISYTKIIKKGVFSDS